MSSSQQDLNNLLKSFDQFVKKMSDSEKNYIILNFGQILFPDNSLDLKAFLKGDKSVVLSKNVNAILMMTKKYSEYNTQIVNFLFNQALN